MLAPAPGHHGATEPLVRMIVALLGGMLIGIEREKARAAAARRKHRRVGLEEFVVKEFPGLRTFSLVSLLASVLGYLASYNTVARSVSLVVTLTFGIVVVTFTAYRLMVARMAGITTIVVLLLDFIIGFVSGLGEILLAASLAVLTTFVLAIKLPAEKIVGKIRYEELLWALELGIVLTVVGPFFLENSSTFYGVSPRSLYLFFTLVLATSYAGYVLARLKGGEGIAYTTIFGGIANSEATLMSVLQLLGGRAESLAFDLTILTNTAMILRNALIAAVVAYSAAGPLPPVQLAPLLLATTLSLVPGYISWLRSLRSLVRVTVEIENPLQFSTAAKSTAIYLALSLLAYTIRETGAGGLLLVSAIGGFVSSSAAIVALLSAGVNKATTLVALSLVATAAGALNKPIYTYLGTRSRATASRSLAASLVHAALLAAAAVPALHGWTAQPP